MAFLDLTLVKRHLNVTGNGHDAEVQAMIDTAEAVIERIVGPVTPTAQDEWHDGGGQLIRLLCAPVTTVAAVTESTGSTTFSLTEQALGGSSFDSYGYTIDKPEGVLIRRVSGSASRFASGRRNVHVTYTAGWATPPADLVMAGQELTRHLWGTQRGSGVQRPGAKPPEALSNTLPGAAYALPIRVEQLLRPYASPGIA